MPLVRSRVLAVALPLCLVLPVVGAGQATAQEASGRPTVLRGQLQEDAVAGDRYVVLDDAGGSAPVLATAPGAVDGVLGPVTDGRAPVAWVHERSTTGGSSIATLRLLAPDGTESTLLTGRVDDVLSEPAFSPDGSTVAVVSDSDTTSALLLVDVRGGGVRTLRSSGLTTYFGPSFSPDGTYLSWAQETDRGSDLATARLATGAATVVASSSTVLWDDTAWSPDGTQLAVARTPLEDEAEEEGFGPTSLALVDLRSGTERVLLRGSVTDSSATFVGQPAWGPDGSAVDVSRAIATRSSVRVERVRVPVASGTPQVVPTTSYAGSPSLSGPRPTDSTAPAAPTGLRTTLSGASVRVVFTPASDTDTADVVVTRVVGAPAATPTSEIEVTRTRTGSVDVPLPSPGTTYGISLFTRDWSGNLSPAATVSVTSPSATALSVSTPPSRVVLRTPVRLSGRLLTASGSPVVGQRVELLVRRAGTRTPVLTRTATTAGDGSYAVSVTPSWTAEYQVRFPGSSAGAPSVSAKRVTSVVPLVSLGLSTSRVARGGTVVLSGAVSPSHAGAVVSVQRLVGGTWRSIGSTRLSATSSYRYVLRPGTSGTWTLRVLKPADVDHLVSTSPSRRLTVR